VWLSSCALVPTAPGAAGVRAHTGHGVTVSFAFFETPPPEAEMVTAVAALPLVVVTVKSAELAPSGTVTVAGTAASAAFELFSVTTVPPAGARPVSVTVAADGLPP
jgi:hypothetical protein